MSVRLADYVPSLLRAIRPPDSTDYSAVTADTMLGYLVDGFWEARLDGFLGDWRSGEDGVVLPNNPTAPDIGRDGIALVVIYASIKVLRNRILNTASSFRGKAGPVEFEQQISSSMLTEMLRQLAALKTSILDQQWTHTVVSIIDAYSVRERNPRSYYGSRELTG